MLGIAASPVSLLELAHSANHIAPTLCIFDVCALTAAKGL
jgi:hypothetical protein